MPTYEYACAKCGHHFEQFQSMSAPRLTKCPKCGKRGLKRLVGGGAGLIFKGSGFYITDYKKSSSAKEGGEGGKKEGEAKPSAAGGKADNPAPAKAEKGGTDKPKGEGKT